MNLHDVHRGIVKHKKRKRLGRGPGSGQGKTAGRGHKGHSSRSGSHLKLGFEGGQTVLIRRIPKRGFHNRFADKTLVVNVGDLNALFESGDEVSIESLRAKRKFPQNFTALKILGSGTLMKKLRVTAHGFSAQAREKISQAGGVAAEAPGPAPVRRADRGKDGQKSTNP